MNRYKLESLRSGVAQELQKATETLDKMYADAGSTMEDRQKQKALVEDIKERLEGINAKIKAMDEEAESRMRKEKAKNDIPNDPKKAREKVKGEFYKAAILGNLSEVRKAYEGLGAIPAGSLDLGGGENLLPTNLATELLTEPFETNSLRRVEPVTNITGLEEAKLDFFIEDEDLEDITDQDTATEIKTEGNLISYGRFKTKVYVTIKDTVLHGSPFNLAGTVESGLRSALAIKEKMRAFDIEPGEDHAHMSFYSAKNAIKEVTGPTLLDAIIAAWADLPDAFSENAVVVMRRTDWAEELRSLANGSEALFGKKPEDIIGIPVIFNDRAVIPVVGDFRYAKQNYDQDVIYEADKDVKKGEYYFVLTAWGDHRIRLKSAFRLAKKANP
jgi:HK97 family phage major capsid protein